MRQVFFIFIFFINAIFVNAQNLFLEECFVGGVTVAGRTSQAFIDGTFKIKWESDFTLKSAYVLTYRYGRPDAKPFMVNGDVFTWDYSSQIGAEQPDEDHVQYFAVHGQNITDHVNIVGDSIHVYMAGQDYVPLHPAQGWWSLDFVFLYTSPSVLDTTCVRIYTASQPQTVPQYYEFSKTNHKSTNDVGFSIYSDRVGGILGSAYDDRTCIYINENKLGCIYGPDATNPGAGGVRGHFYYENGFLYGLDDDTANTQVYRSDGIAVINEYLNEQPMQTLFLNPVNYQSPLIRFNPHPAFFIAYTPDGCTLPSAETPREYSTCRCQSMPLGQPDRVDSLSLSATPGYDHYDWTPGDAMNDSALANPILAPDSSGWYRVSMWDDDGATCPQTIPVFVEVGDVPRPTTLEIKPSACPQNTGRITAIKTPGKNR